MTVRIRPAELADHPVFVRLFPELGVRDPVLDEAAFAHQLLPTTLIADSVSAGGESHGVGYAYFQIMKDTVYLRHLVTAPEARRTGVARALLGAIVARARAAGATTWCLNVKPDNAPAIALYEALGMTRAHTSRALDMTWAAIEASPVAGEPGLVAREITPADDSRVETAMALLEGQLASTRAVGGRILTMLEQGGRVVGASIFNPDFPGAYPFRVARPALAFDLLRALRPHARPHHEALGVVTENQPELADLLIAAGATVKLEILHLKGPLPDHSTSASATPDAATR